MNKASKCKCEDLREPLKRNKTDRGLREKISETLRLIYVGKDSMGDPLRVYECKTCYSTLTS